MHRQVIAALAVVMLASCVPRQPSPAPTLQVFDQLPEPDVLLESLEARRAAVRGVSTIARLAYTAPGESQRAKHVIIAERPDRLRLEVLSPFGVVLVLTSSDGTLSAYARDEATVYRGTASAENLKRYVQVELPISTAVDLILGTPPLRAHYYSVVSRDDGLVKLWQGEGRDVRVAWFGAGLDPTRYEQRDEEGHVILRATFDDYADFDGERMPTRLGLELPSAEQRIDITLSDPEVNPALADALFALETPEGSREINLDREAP